MPIRAYLYDATGPDRAVELTPDLVAGLNEKKLLWADVTDFGERELRRVASILDLTQDSLYSLLDLEHRPRLDNYGRYAQFNVSAIEGPEGRYKKADVGFVLGANIVVTIHRKPVAFLESFDHRVKGDTDLGELDAPGFLAALLDWHITGYFRLVEDLEKQVDSIDSHALRPRHSRDLLRELARLQQRVSVVRSILTPHREVYAAMARPDFLPVANSSSAAHFRNLSDRLDRAIEAVENARELLVGSFDMFTTQTTLRTNEVMKALTLASFIWFPSSVIVGIAALLLRAPVDPSNTPGFWAMLASIGVVGLVTLAIARYRGWI